MILPKHIQEARDEMARNTYENGRSLEEVSLQTQGFDLAWQLAMNEVKVLVEALEKINSYLDEPNTSSSGFHEEIAEAALATYHERMTPDTGVLTADEMEKLHDE